MIFFEKAESSETIVLSTLCAADHCLDHNPDTMKQYVPRLNVRTTDDKTTGAVHSMHVLISLDTANLIPHLTHNRRSCAVVLW
eukprot:m.155638 g.155638  ORF g.155638 m.155638 type:complete len:83 (+) comp30946_c1_seq3:84-332(+)